MADVQPTATGNLQATPFPHLLVYVLDRQLDGTLVFETPEGKRSALFLEGGAPAKARTAEPVIYLGRLLLEMGLIDEAAHNRTLAQVAQTRELHGQILIAEGVLDGETLRAALREQIARQVLWMFTLPEQTAYGYYADVNFLEQWGGPESTRVQPLGLLWRGIRSYADDARVAQALDRLGETPLHLHPDGQIARFNFGPAEQALIDVLRVKPQSLAQLANTGLVSEAILRRLTYTLMITRHLDLGVPGAIPVGVDEAPSSSRIAIFDGAAEVRRRRLNASKRFRSGENVPYDPGGSGERATPASARGAQPVAVAEPSAPSLSPQQRAFMEEIRVLTHSIAELDYYQILGVPRDAPRAVIQGAFFQLAKRWHPDRVGVEIGELRADASRIFAKMSEAHLVLSDERMRVEYNAVLKEGAANDAEQDEIQAVLRAATAFQKAEVLLKRNNLSGAEEQARIALENDPTQADYIALHGWIQAQRPDLDGQTLEQLIERLSVAVKHEPENTRARWYRGQLLKRANNYEQAIRDFRYIVERDPKHLDALREIRLYEMRRNALRNTPAHRNSTIPPKPGSKPPSNSPAPRRTVPPPPKKGGIMNKDIGDILGKWFKR